MYNPDQKGASTSINAYKYQGIMHIIHHRMYNVFEIPDTNNPEVKWDLFQWLGSLPLKYVITHIHKIRITYGK